MQESVRAKGAIERPITIESPDIGAAGVRSDQLVIEVKVASDDQSAVAFAEQHRPSRAGAGWCKGDCSGALLSPRTEASIETAIRIEPKQSAVRCIVPTIDLNDANYFPGW